MSDSFYMITPKIEYPKQVPWGRTKRYAKYRDERSKADQLRKERANAIGRYMKANKKRNHFTTKVDAEMYIIQMGLPFPCEVNEAFWAF